MLVRFLLPILLLIFVLSSCAKEKGSEKPASNLPAGTTAEAFLVPSATLSDAQEMAKTASVTCAAGESCSPSIGLLAFADAENGGQCTATLVNEDTVITNAHCVPTDIQKSGADCTNRIWMHFTKSDNPNFETSIGCSKILIAKGGSATMESESQADYAFVKLNKKTIRPSLRLSRAGMKNGEVLTLEKVNPVRTPGVIRGEQTSVTCKAAQNTYFIRGFNNDLAPVAVISDCEARHGNSGSSLRASDGTIRGVLFAITEPDTFKQAYTELRMQVGEPMARLNLGANLSCLAIPSSVSSEPFSKECSTLSSYKNPTYEKLDASANEQLTAHFVDKQSKYAAAGWLRWKWARPSQSQIAYEATCVQASKVVLGKSASVGALTLNLDVKLDGYTRFQSLSLSEEGGNQQVLVKKSGSGYSVKVNGSTKTLPACDAQ